MYNTVYLAPDFILKEIGKVAPDFPGKVAPDFPQQLSCRELPQAIPELLKTG